MLGRRLSILILVLGLTYTAFSQFEPQPAPADSLSQDSSFIIAPEFPDSASVEAMPLKHRWLFPVGAVVAAGLTFAGLFFIRSR